MLLSGPRLVWRKWPTTIQCTIEISGKTKGNVNVRMRSILVERCAADSITWVM
jgi:hypothetical protein